MDARVSAFMQMCEFNWSVICSQLTFCICKVQIPKLLTGMCDPNPSLLADWWAVRCTKVCGGNQIYDTTDQCEGRFILYAVHLDWQVFLYNSQNTISRPKPVTGGFGYKLQWCVLLIKHALFRSASSPVSMFPEVFCNEALTPMRPLPLC